MTKISFDTGQAAGRGHDQPVTPAVDGLLPPARRSGSTCDLYAPGHQMHYRHQGDAVRSPAKAVREMVSDGPRLTLTLDDGDELHWMHHDADRLTRILELLRGKGVVYQKFHALRVGPYWFNCADESEQPLTCRISSSRARSL